MPHPPTNFLYDYHPVKLRALENGGEKIVCGCVSGCIDYTSFGMTIPGKSWTAGGTGYRYAFNGKEIDTIGMGGGGSTYDYGFRIYNAQIAKFLSVDPLAASYPWYTPYQFAGNKPIACIDLDGLEELLVVRWYDQDKYVGETYHYIQSDQRAYDEGVIYANASIHSQIDIDMFKVKAIPSESKYTGYNLVMQNIYQRKLTDAAFKQFFSIDDNNNIILKSDVNYSSTFENSYFEGEAIAAIRRYVNDASNNTTTYKSPNAYTVYYNYDKYNSLQLNLTQDVIDGYVGFLISNPHFSLTIVGHTSTEGTDEYNYNLGLNRASDVGSLLIKGGVPKEKIVISSQGETNPAVSPDNTEKEKEQNRRVTISYTPSK